MESLNEVPDEIREFVSMAADGDVEALASATWWALIYGKESLGVEWFDEFNGKITPSDTSELTEFEESRLANVVSNYGFLKLAIDFSDNEAREALDLAAKYSPEAAFAPALIAHRAGETDQCNNALANLSAEQISELKNTYERVVQTGEEDGVSDTWFLNWASEALELLANISSESGSEPKMHFEFNSNLMMRPVQGIYLGGATIYFADALGGQTGTLIQEKIEVFLGYDCGAVVASLELDSETVGLVVFPFGPMFLFEAPEPLLIVAQALESLLEEAEPNAEVPAVQFVPEHLIYSDGIEIGTLSHPSKILVTGFAEESEIGADPDSEIVIDANGEMKVYSFTKEMVGGIVIVLRSDLINF